MQPRFTIGILLFILLLAGFVRLYHLSSVPPSPYLDEVSNGYNAYSLLKTGNDEYGRHFPLLLQAYNDFRPALFVYFMIPSIALFGLSVFSIRLPAVILTLLTTLSLFFLTKKLLSKNANEKAQQKSFNYSSLSQQATSVALGASFLYAISPWSIYSSRISDEINMSLSFFVFAITFFLYAIDSKKMQKNNIFSFFTSIVFFVLSFYAYHGIKLFLPFFIITISILFYKKLLSQWKISLIGIILGVFLLIPLVITFMTPGTAVRLGAVGTQDPTLIAQSAQREVSDKINHDFLGVLFDNRRVLTSLAFLNNYFRNYSLTWLFLQQGNSTYLVPDFGPFYLFELPLLLVGIFALIKDDSVTVRIKILMLFWIVFSAIPSGISSESPHLNRANTLLPGLTMLEAIGLYRLFFYITSVDNQYLRRISYSVVSVIIFISFLWFLHAYFIEFPYVHSKVYQQGIIDAFIYGKAHEEKYDKIIVSNGGILLEGYMYYLFATKYNPSLYQKLGGTHSAFFTDTHLIGKYDFRNPNLYEPTKTSPTRSIKILYITNPSELSQQIVNNEKLHMIQKFQLRNSDDAIWILDGNL